MIERVFYKYGKSQLDFTVVEDIAQPGAFKDAVLSNPPFEAVIHTASPFHYNVKDIQKVSISSEGSSPGLILYRTLLIRLSLAQQISCRRLRNMHQVSAKWSLHLPSPPWLILPWEVGPNIRIRKKIGIL